MDRKEINFGKYQAILCKAGNGVYHVCITKVCGNSFELFDDLYAPVEILIDKENVSAKSYKAAVQSVLACNPKLLRVFNKKEKV